jgi:hypothetical protein
MIWRANGVSGGGSKLENWILRLIMGCSGRFKCVFSFLVIMLACTTFDISKDISYV